MPVLKMIIGYRVLISPVFMDKDTSEPLTTTCQMITMTYSACNLTLGFYGGSGGVCPFLANVHEFFSFILNSSYLSIKGRKIQLFSK